VRVFPPLLCAIVLGVIPWRRFVSFRRAVYRFEPKFKIAAGGLSHLFYYIILITIAWWNRSLVTKSPLFFLFFLYINFVSTLLSIASDR